MSRLSMHKVVLYVRENLGFRSASLFLRYMKFRLEQGSFHSEFCDSVLTNLRKVLYTLLWLVGAWGTVTGIFAIGHHCLHYESSVKTLREISYRRCRRVNTKSKIPYECWERVKRIPIRAKNYTDTLSVLLVAWCMACIVTQGREYEMPSSGQFCKSWAVNSFSRRDVSKWLQFWQKVRRFFTPSKPARSVL